MIVSKGCQDKIFLFRSRIGLWKSLIDYFLKGTCMEHPVKFVEINFAFFTRLFINVISDFFVEGEQ